MVIAPSDFRDEELLEPKALFEAEGAVVEVASTIAGPAHGMLGAEVTPDLTVAGANPHRYVAVVVVGGRGAPDYLWGHAPLHALLRLAHADGIPVAAICLSGVVLARAGLLRGVRATVFGVPRAKHELLRGGALYVEEEVVVDDGIVTAAGPEAARAFARAVLQKLRAPGRPAPSAA